MLQVRGSSAFPTDRTLRQEMAHDHLTLGTGDLAAQEAQEKLRPEVFARSRHGPWRQPARFGVSKGEGRVIAGRQLPESGKRSSAETGVWNFLLSSANKRLGIRVRLSRQGILAVLL